MSTELPDSYYEQPILDALRACVSGEFANWSPDQHAHLASWTDKYPHALGWAAATFLAERGPRFPAKVWPQDELDHDIPF